jgi:hypothetical protein
MRHFSYLEMNQEDINTPTIVTMTEDEILAQYYEYWQGEMRKVGKADQISPEACLEDFVAVHWAYEVP